MKKIGKELIPYVIIVVVVFFIRTFIITPVRVYGSSMENTLKNNDILLLKKFDKKYDRYDVVVINHTNENYKTERIIKRVIALPGETIYVKNGKIYVNDKEISENYTKTITFDFDKVKLSDDEYFVMGDNRMNSEDSRSIGPVKKERILGTVNFRLYPFSKFGKIN